MRDNMIYYGHMKKQEIYFRKTVTDCVVDTSNGERLIYGHVTDDYGFKGYCRFRRGHNSGDTIIVKRERYGGSYREVTSTKGGVIWE